MHRLNSNFQTNPHIFFKSGNLICTYYYFCFICCCYYYLFFVAVVVNYYVWQRVTSRTPLVRTRLNMYSCCSICIYHSTSFVLVLYCSCFCVLILLKWNLVSKSKTWLLLQFLRVYMHTVCSSKCCTRHTYIYLHIYTYYLPLACVCVCCLQCHWYHTCNKVLIAASTILFGSSPRHLAIICIHTHPRIHTYLHSYNKFCVHDIFYEYSVMLNMLQQWLCAATTPTTTKLCTHIVFICKLQSNGKKYSLPSCVHDKCIIFVHSLKSRNFMTATTTKRKCGIIKRINNCNNNNTQIRDFKFYIAAAAAAVMTSFQLQYLCIYSNVHVNT